MKIIEYTRFLWAILRRQPKKKHYWTTEEWAEFYADISAFKDLPRHEFGSITNRIFQSGEVK